MLTVTELPGIGQRKRFNDLPFEIHCDAAGCYAHGKYENAAQAWRFGWRLEGKSMWCPDCVQAAYCLPSGSAAKTPRKISKR